MNLHYSGDLWRDLGSGGKLIVWDVYKGLGLRACRVRQEGSGLRSKGWGCIGWGLRSRV